VTESSMNPAAAVSFTLASPAATLRKGIDASVA
jgi:hypothetical protein